MLELHRMYASDMLKNLCGNQLGSDWLVLETGKRSSSISQQTLTQGIEDGGLK